MSKANYTKLLNELLVAEKDGNTSNLKQMIVSMISELDVESNNKKNNVKDLQKNILAYLKQSAKLNNNVRPILSKANINNDTIELCNGFSVIIINNANVDGLPLVETGDFPKVKEFFKVTDYVELDYTINSLELSKKLALRKAEKNVNIVNSMFIDCKYIDVDLLNPVLKILGNDIKIYGNGKDNSAIILESKIGKALILPWKPKNKG